VEGGYALEHIATEEVTCRGLALAMVENGT
jgi:hypothetical protein